ncbi:unnamed protein product [Trichogramma brassicae]|uniref:tRNA-uridine aminocarboxypropyltransferase 1 n=1 Tax=Trichogramma brassicae TaxID=86971 RepID=A0A6H5II78_9HYME|nr:unnamed protein product [Trichogramma brassicae]
MSEANSKNIDEIQAENRQILEEKQKLIDNAPFEHLKIDDASCLETIESREICGKCFKSRKFFCYTCYTPVIDEKYLPRIKLPIKIDIIKHAREIDGKSTAAHAAVLAPEDVKIYIYPEFPEISKDEKVVLIFPSKNAMSIEDLFKEKKDEDGQVVFETIKNQFPVTRAIFIDSTWHQTKSIYKDQRLRDLPCVVLKSRISQFWRHQKNSPRWYLATIEALHQFLLELHTNAFGIIENYVKPETDVSKTSKTVTTESDLYGPYNGQYDNLLYFFKFMYETIHRYYDHEKLWAYKRPLI